MVYTIGDVGGALSSAYSFAEDTQCNYPQTVTVTGEHPLFKHNADDQTFEVFETQDLALEGVFTVTVQSEIEFWADYTMTSTINIFEEFTFTIEMVNPCHSTILEPMTVNDMTQFVSDPEMSTVVVNSQDSISQTLGD